MGCCQLISPEPLQRRVGFGLLLALILLFAGGKAILFDTLDPDFFWHYRVAEQLQRDGVGPLIDHISFASLKTPWTPYSWLAELGMKAIWDRYGLMGAVFTQSVMVAGIFAMIALCCRVVVSKSGDANDQLLATVLATALAAGVSLPYLSFRPATAATLILAIIVYLLLRDRRRGELSKFVWLVPILTAFCVNLHFFAIFAVLWTGALFTGSLWEFLRNRSTENHRRLKRTALLLLFVSIGFLATPMLPGMLKAIFSYRTGDPMVHSWQIAELAPFWRGIGGMITAGILLTALAIILLNGRNHRAGELLWLIGMIVLASEMGRFLSLAMIIIAPMLARSLPRLSDRPLELPVVRYATAGLVLICLLRISLNLPTSRAMPNWLNRHGADAPGYPIAAADYVDRNITPRSHRLINEFSWGGYLAYRLGDHYQVLLDGRTQVHSPDFWRATYLGTDEQMREVLHHADGDAAIVPVARSRFRSTLMSMGWVTAFKDDRAEVLVPPANVARGME
jgi:hypothetical protein